MFVVFEGIDGAGKTTIINKLYNEMIIHGGNSEVLLVREPGSTKLGEEIRRIIHNPNIEMPSLAEFLLFCAARNTLIESTIRPAIEEGLVVLSDRFSYSSIAYQGAGLRLDQGNKKFMSTVINTIEYHCKPDLVILLDIPAKVSVERTNKDNIGTQKDKIESRELDFFKRARSNYLKQAKEDLQSKWIVVDARIPIGEVYQKVKEVVTLELHNIKERRNGKS